MFEFLSQKVRKSLESLEKFGKRVFWTFVNFGNFGNFGNCSIPNFPKIKKKDVKLELQKLLKTRSDLKTDSKVRLKDWNAGPYSLYIKTSWYETVPIFSFVCSITFIFWAISTHRKMWLKWIYCLFPSCVFFIICFFLDWKKNHRMLYQLSNISLDKNSYKTTEIIKDSALLI